MSKEEHEKWIEFAVDSIESVEKKKEKLRTTNVDRTGAVIVENGEIIARAANFYGQHAEVGALNNAGKKDLSNSTMYVTKIPCSFCGKEMAEANIKTMVYQHFDLNKDPYVYPNDPKGNALMANYYSKENQFEYKNKLESGDTKYSLRKDGDIFEYPDYYLVETKLKPMSEKS